MKIVSFPRPIKHYIPKLQLVDVHLKIQRIQIKDSWGHLDAMPICFD